MQFLKQVLTREKKVNFNINDLKIVKRVKIIELIVPKYQELSVDKLLFFVKSVEDLACYFTDYIEKQLSNKKFIFAKLAISRLK